MNTTSTVEKHGELLDLRCAEGSKVFTDTREPQKRSKLDLDSKLTVFKLVSSFLVAFAGIAGYWVAGLL